MYEGDSNLSDMRSLWGDTVSAEAQHLLSEDAHWFFRQALSTPCLQGVSSAQGLYLTDSDGHRLMDFHGNNVHQIGYGHPRVLDVVWQQLQVLPFVPRRYTNAAAIALAQRLSTLAPIEEGKVLLVPGAAEAVSIALKVARAVTGRYKTLSFYGSFHGATLDALSVGGQQDFTTGLGPLLPGSLHTQGFSPDQCAFGCGGHCHWGCLQSVEQILRQEGDVGLVLLETIRNTDVRIPPTEYYPELRAICHRHGALLAVDETAIAWGRTGKMFAVEHFGIRPDIIIVGKGLGAGVYPLAAAIIAGEWDHVPERSVGHFTFEKSPVGAVAALTMLTVVEEEHLLQRAQDLGAYFFQLLDSLRARHTSVGDIRQIGLLIAVDIVHPHNHQPWAVGAEEILYRCLKGGLNFKVSEGSILSLTPPLIVTTAQLDHAVEILHTALTVTETSL